MKPAARLQLTFAHLRKTRTDLVLLVSRIKDEDTPCLEWLSRFEELDISQYRRELGIVPLNHQRSKLWESAWVDDREEDLPSLD
jgi:hypothetical protein